MRSTESIWLPRYEEPTEEGKEAMRQVLAQIVDQKGADIAKDFLNLTRQQDHDIDFRWLGMQIYVAGKLAGIRAERQRRKANKEKLHNSCVEVV